MTSIQGHILEVHMFIYNLGGFSCFVVSVAVICLHALPFSYNGTLVVLLLMLCTLGGIATIKKRIAYYYKLMLLYL